MEERERGRERERERERERASLKEQRARKVSKRAATMDDG